MDYETIKESFVTYLLTDLLERYPRASWALDGVAKNLFVSIRDGGALIVISHVKDDWTVVRKVNDAAGTVDWSYDSISEKSFVRFCALRNVEYDAKYGFDDDLEF